MSENNTIENLPPQDYSTQPREHINYIGQVAGIRKFDPTDRIDMQRLEKITNHKEAMEWMVGGETSEQDILDWAATDWKVKGANKDALFAITAATPGVEKALTVEDEIGEVQGFTWFYYGNDERENFQKVIDKKIVEKPSTADPIYEISYAKHPDAPPRHIASGIRQACLELFKAGRRKNESPSVEKPKMHILAYIDPNNKNSILVAEASGFERKGSIVLEDEQGNPEENEVYTLNWEKLNNLMHKFADDEFWKDKLQTSTV